MWALWKAAGLGQCQRTVAIEYDWHRLRRICRIIIQLGIAALTEMPIAMRVINAMFALAHRYNPGPLLH